MGTAVMHDDRGTFCLFIHERLDIIWVRLCTDNAYGGRICCCYDDDDDYYY